MPMKLVTIIQLGTVFGVYSLMVLVLPAVLFGNKLRGYRLMGRFFIYITIGNFYMMNLVFLLQLLHISNRFTLIAGTLLPAAVVLVRLRALSMKAVLKTQWIYFVRFSRGRVGGKTLAGTVLDWMGYRLRAAGRWILVQMRQSFMEWIAVGIVAGLLCWQYGTNVLEKFGYGASDIIVHNYWINAMGDGDIFVAGVYPFGFHCVIYYLHKVFNIDTYVLLRVFCFVQMFYLHMVLLAFIRLCCKTRFSVYIGVVIFAIGNFFFENTYLRYYSSLPQEFGILFILPAIWFLFDFLNVKRGEIKQSRHALFDLLFFAFSFSMTLAVHFYGTMIAGLFCVAVAVAYFPRIFKKEYLWRIFAAGILSIALAVLPMGVAFITGTPLQGSLKWGMNVITGSTEKVEDNKEEGKEGEQTDDNNKGNGKEGEQTDENNKENGKEEQQTGNEAGIITGTEEGISTSGQQAGKDKAQGIVREEKPEAAVWSSERRTEAVRKRLGDLLRSPLGVVEKITDQVQYAMADNVFCEYKESLAALVVTIIGILLAGGLVCIFLAPGDYGRRLIASGIFILLLTILLASNRFGLPELMDSNRASVYLTYMLPILWAMGLDLVLTAMFGWFWKGKIADLASLTALAAMIFVMLMKGLYREPLIITTGETNGAITCLTNIIKENEDETWTICSANDEMQMGKDHGWHYELIDFLRGMEGNNWNSILHIPTKKVYFFIEKIPLLYYTEDPKWVERQRVSSEGAARELPRGSSLSIYSGENRWIVMSRMYEWANEFSKLYSNELKVYYEDEEFICYSLEQNEYRLYNFAIDYRYNTLFVSGTGVEQAW